MLFVTGPETMSKTRFLVKCLLPSVILGFIPYIIFLIYPKYHMLGILGALGIASAAGDFYHAGTALDADGQIVTAGGRVLDVTAVAPTFEEARANAYAACDLIDFDGKQFRTDIGQKAILGRDAL